MRFLIFLLAGIGLTWLVLHFAAGATAGGAPFAILFAAFLIWARGLDRKARP